MRKTSIASFIVALVLIVASIALFVLGFLFVNAPQVYSRIGNGYSYMRVSYSFSLARAANGFMFILLGGFLFIGGILLLVLAAVTRSGVSKSSKKCAQIKKTTPVEDSTCSACSACDSGDSGNAKVSEVSEVSAVSAKSDSVESSSADSSNI